MKKQFKQISKINKIDKASHSDRLCKLFEECGELAQGVNKTIGRKVHKKSKQEILDNICEEGADVIQNVFCLLDGYGIKYEDIEKTLSEKNSVWSKIIKNSKK